MFSSPQFDERDLVRIDKEVQAKFEEIKLNSKESEKQKKEEETEKPVPVKATLKNIDLLDDLTSLKQENDDQSRANMLKSFGAGGLNTRYNGSIKSKMPAD